MGDVENTKQICRDLIEKIVKENDYDSDFKVTPISTEGANYTTHLFIATLTKKDETISLFAKVAAAGEKLRAQNPLQMYETENFMYTKIMKVYHDLEDKNSISKEHRLKIPKFYACNSKEYEETLVLENLVSKGFTTHDRLQTVDWAYASTSIKELAKFHALSIAYQNNDPEEFEKDKEKLKVEFKKNVHHQAYFKKLIKNALDVTKEENKDKLKRFLEEFMLNRGIWEFCQPKKQSVITHGDYKPSNLMHIQLKDGSLEVIPVDFQTVLVGCPINDLLYFIFTATDEEFRRKYYQRLIDHYYTQFSEALKRLGVDPEEAYSRADFDFELKETLPYGLCVAVLILPIVTVEAKNAPMVDKDMDLSTFSAPLNGELFPQRLNGIVDDYIRWGVLA